VTIVKSDSSAFLRNRGTVAEIPEWGERRLGWRKGTIVTVTWHGVTRKRGGSGEGGARELLTETALYTFPLEIGRSPKRFTRPKAIYEKEKENRIPNVYQDQTEKPLSRF